MADGLAGRAGLILIQFGFCSGFRNDEKWDGGAVCGGLWTVWARCKFYEFFGEKDERKVGWRTLDGFLERRAAK